jgi:hypothetical protein
MRREPADVGQSKPSLRLLTGSLSRDRVSATTLILVSVLVDGTLAGAIYALIALAFVIVDKGLRITNFALGEWFRFGAMRAAASSMRSCHFPNIVDALDLAAIDRIRQRPRADAEHVAAIVKQQTSRLDRALWIGKASDFHDAVG